MDIGETKFHPVLGPVKIAEENLINSIPGRIFVLSGAVDAPELLHVSESDLRDACLECDGLGVRDLGGLLLECDRCKGNGYV